MYIPDELLPPIEEWGNVGPKLPSQKEMHGSNAGIKGASALNKSRFYYQEALARLALARFYLKKAEEEYERNQRGREER